MRWRLLPKALGVGCCVFGAKLGICVGGHKQVVLGARRHVLNAQVMCDLSGL